MVGEDQQAPLRIESLVGEWEVIKSTEYKELRIRYPCFVFEPVR